MCDYSLAAVNNRLAQEGEVLVFHKFSSGSLGLASPADIEEKRMTYYDLVNRKLNIFQVIKKWFSEPPKMEEPCAVCLPPGAVVHVMNIPVRLFAIYRLTKSEPAYFTQTSAKENTHRDALLFLNGRTVKLQEFREGVLVNVLDLSCSQDREETFENGQAIEISQLAR